MSEADDKQIPACLGDDFIKKVPDINTKRNGRFNEFYEVMRKRLYCNDKCKYFKMCPLQPYSQSEDNQNKDGKYPCLLKQKSPSEQQTYLNLFLNGRYGMANELLIAAFAIRDTLDLSNKRDAREYLEMLIKVNKELYGSAKNVEAPPDMEVKITEVAKAPDIGDRSGGLKKNYSLPVPDKEDDPESLLLDNDYVTAYIHGDDLNDGKEYIE